MRKIAIILTLAVTTLCTPQAHAQEKLTLDQLTERLVEVNYKLEITRLEKDIVANNVTNAQFMPSLRASASQSQNIGGAIGNLDHNNPNGWRGTNTLGAGVSLGWTLFDGLGMFATHDRQKELLTVSELDLRYDVETMVSELANEYYMIISLMNRVDVARESMELSQLRYKEVFDKYSIESASGLELRLAKTDLNADSSNLIKRLEELDLAYIGMNGKLNYDFSRRGYIKDTIILRGRLSPEDLQDNILETNTDILLARSGVEIADIDIRLAKAAKYPTLDFGAGYNYSGYDGNNFRGTFANSQGINWGFNMSVNIFDGLEAKRRLNNAKIDKLISKVNERNVETSVLGAFNTLYTNYINNLQLIDFETENAEASRLNLDVAMLRYRLGDMSGLDFRNIQQQYLAAFERKINVIYQAKASEISLLRLAGKVVEAVGPVDAE